MMININGVMPMCSPHGYHYNGIPFNTDMQKHLLKKHPVHKQPHCVQNCPRSPMPHPPIFNLFFSFISILISLVIHFCSISVTPPVSHTLNLIFIFNVLSASLFMSRHIWSILSVLSPHPLTTFSANLFKWFSPFL